MIESIRKMWKIEELRKKILYTFMMLVLFRLVGVIPAPGVDVGKGGFPIAPLNPFGAAVGAGQHDDR